MKTIECNECGAVIEQRKDLLQHQVIDKDDSGQDIQETFFTCQSCGAHYTVIITDRPMRLIIEKRKTIRKKIGRAMKSCTKKNVVATRMQVDKLVAEDEELRKQLKKMSTQLKEKYKEE